MSCKLQSRLKLDRVYNLEVKSQRHLYFQIADMTLESMVKVTYTYIRLTKQISSSFFFDGGCLYLAKWSCIPRADTLTVPTQILRAQKSKDVLDFDL